MSGELGSLVVSLSADIARFQSDLGRANHIAEQQARQIQAAFTTIKTAISAVAGSAIVAYVKGLVDAAEDTNRLAQRVGYTVEQFSAFSVAAKLGKVSSEEFAGAAARFNKSLVEGSESSSKMGKLFKALGVDITQGPAEAMRQFAARASAIEDASVKTAVFKEVMGKTGDTLIPVFAKLAETTEQAKKMGAVLSTETAEAAAKLNDNLTLLSTTGQTVMITALTPMVGAFATIVENINKATEQGQKYTQMLRELGNVSMAMIGGVAEKLLSLPSWMLSPINRALLTGAQRATEVGFNVISQAGAGSRTSGGQIGTTNILGGAGAGRGLVVPEAPSSDALRKLLADTGAKGPDVFKDFKQRLEQEVARSGELLSIEKVINELQEARYNKLSPAQRQELKDLANIADLKKLDHDRLKQYAQDEATIAADKMQALAQERAAREQLAAQTAQAMADNLARSIDASGFANDQVENAKELKAYLQEGNEWAKELGLTFSSAFEAAVAGGKDLRSVLQGLIQDLAKMAAREFITKPVAAAFGKLAEGIGGGAGALAGLKRLFAGGGGATVPASDGVDYGQYFADGGVARANSWAMVGERGPELAYFGAGGGTVVPNRGGGGPVFNVDMRGASVDAVARLERLVASINGSIEQRSGTLMRESGRRT